MKVTIIGIGNILLQDEGVGVHAIKKLLERYEFPEDVTIIDGGTMGLDLLPFIENSERLIFIDAVDHKQAPGTIVIIEDKEIPAIFKTKISPHQIGLADLFFAMKLLSIEPKSIAVIGIQPKSMHTSTELSEKISHNLDGLISAIIDKLLNWGIEVRAKDVSRYSF